VVEDLAAMGITPDQTLINCGGGGLASGSFTVYCDAYPGIQCYVVEPDEFDDVKRSLESGTIETVDFGARSICDALLTPSAGKRTFPILQGSSAKGLSVTDEQARAAVSFAAKNLKLIGEPGGVVSLAAVLEGKVDTKDKVTVCIISGGNIDPEMLADCMARF